MPTWPRVTRPCAAGWTRGVIRRLSDNGSRLELLLQLLMEVHTRLGIFFLARVHDARMTFDGAITGNVASARPRKLMGGGACNASFDCVVSGALFDHRKSYIMNVLSTKHPLHLTATPS